MRKFDRIFVVSRLLSSYSSIAAWGMIYSYNLGAIHRTSGEEVTVGVILLILGSVILGSLGQISLKLAMNNIGGLSFKSMGQLFGLVAKVATTPLIILGFALYGLAASVWLVVLSKTEVSFAYPMISLSYVMVVTLSMFLLGENVSLTRWLGVGVICLGVILISRS